LVGPSFILSIYATASFTAFTTAASFFFFFFFFFFLPSSSPYFFFFLARKKMCGREEKEETKEKKEKQQQKIPLERGNKIPFVLQSPSPVTLPVGSSRFSTNQTL
jgi:hypothetical protein